MGEYADDHPDFVSDVGMISWAIVYFTLWPKGCPWHDILLMVAIIGFLIEYGYLASLNYM
jgi:hypothetical protein